MIPTNSQRSPVRICPLHFTMCPFVSGVFYVPYSVTDRLLFYGHISSIDTKRKYKLQEINAKSVLFCPSCPKDN